MLPSPQSSVAESPKKKPRRPRAIQACNFCRAKKYKCDGAYPCTHCRKHGSECQFRNPEGSNPAARTFSVSYVRDLERRLEAAESAAKPAAPSPSAGSDASAATPNRRSSLSQVMIATPSSPEPARAPARPVYSIQSVLSSNPTELVPRTHSHAVDSPDNIDDAGSPEVMDINPATNTIEYHGNTSSVAFLGHVRDEYASTGTAQQAQEQPSVSEGPSLVSTFHNPALLTPRGLPAHDDISSEQFYPQLAYVFLESYFGNLHFIHPIIERDSFLARCEDLWHGDPNKQSRSFHALYFSILSLGALIRTWTENKINGMGRFEWSRMLMQRADQTIGPAGTLNDLECVQSLFILAKVCQNELNPNLAYMYLGRAIRTALSAGINRNTSLNSRRQITQQDALNKSRTWWGLYSLEIETSFALGRPDTLGLDEYHNRPLPPLDPDSETCIIPCMIEMARIMRSVSTCIYLSRLTLPEKLAHAIRIERDMDLWVKHLPPKIQPDMGAETQFLGVSLCDPLWARRQRMVLRIRYLNVKMVLLRPFLLHAAKKSRSEVPPPDLASAVARCTDAAIRTISTIYETCRLHTFFRTWWYNTTYITFAASILLFQASIQNPNTLLPHVDRSLEILDAMGDSIVPHKTADFLRCIVNRLRERSGETSQVPTNPTTPFEYATWQQVPETPPGLDVFSDELWDLVGDPEGWELGGMEAELLRPLFSV